MASAREAYQQAKPGSRVIGWKFDGPQRGELLKRFPPTYAETVADHVTLAAKVSAESALPEESEGEIVGRSDDGSGVEAMVVRLGGTTNRPDGSAYHITWSLGAGRRAKESNDVIAQNGWTQIDPPLPITLRPERF